MALFGKKKKKPATFTGSEWGSDAWGGEPAADVAPPEEEFDLSGLRRAADALPLIAALEPIFLYVCEQRRVVRAGKDREFSVVRKEVETLIDELQRKGDRDSVLRQQIDGIAPSLIFYLDFNFADPESPFTFHEEWNARRLANDGKFLDEKEQRLMEEDSLTGDEAFFDPLLDDALEERPDDRLANERLVFYYTAIGLGFLGFYRKDNERHRKKLRDYMNRIYPRIQDWIDPRPDDELTPGAYENVNESDLITPARERPLMFVAGFILLIMTLMVGYVLLFQQHAGPLEGAMGEVEGYRSDDPVGVSQAGN